MLRETLKESRAMLGDRHPDTVIGTLTSIINLGVCCTLRASSTRRSRCFARGSRGSRHAVDGAI